MVESIDSSTLVNIYEDKFNFKVYAGPGAGKTYFLVQNIKDIIEHSKRLKSSNIRKILCITYTNAAVDEIKQRLGEYNKYCVVSTIHSFLYQYVIHPYQKQLKIIINNLFNIDIDDSIEFYPRAEGFGLLSKVKVSDFIGILIEKYQIFVAKELTKKKISDCVLDITNINNYPFKEDKEPFLKGFKGVTDEDLLKIKTALWKEEGVLDFDEILYFSYILLKKYNFISYDLNYLFPYILMDEYQDTNPIQNKMLDLLCNKNVTIGVVGDTAQSIYGFIQSTYKEFETFHPSSKDFKTFVIDGNRRSNQNIIYFLNYIRKRDENLDKQKCLVNNSLSKVKFVLCTDENKDILKELNLSNIKVLCRRWSDAFSYITNIDEEQRYLLKSVHDYYRYVIDIDLTREFETAKINWINNIRSIILIRKAVSLGNFAGIIEVINRIFDIDLIKSKRVKGKELSEIIKFINLFKTLKDEMIYYDIVNKINVFIRNTTLKSYGELELVNEEDELFNEDFHPYLNSLNLKTLEIMYEDVFA